MKTAYTMTLALALGISLFARADSTAGTEAKATATAASKERTALVVVGHGAPATDFPREKLRAIIELERQITAAGGEESAPKEIVEKLEELEREARRHPRNERNDPYNAAVQRLAQAIARKGKFGTVLVAHNEFCGLDVDEAVDEAVKSGATKVFVATTMITPNNRHSDVDIAMKVARAQNKHPNVQVIYVWPIAVNNIADFFVNEIERHAKAASNQ